MERVKMWGGVVRGVLTEVSRQLMRQMQLFLKQIVFQTIILSFITESVKPTYSGADPREIGTVVVSYEVGRLNADQGSTLKIVFDA
jgi:hypothetical protein